MSRVGWVRLAVAVGCACVVGFGGGTAAAAGRCPNEQFRTGRSASLPDCRAYELVTPPELGRTADMLFEENEDKAVVSSDGDHFVLEAHGAYLEPGVSNHGTQAVFSRTPTGWAMKSIPSPGMAGEGVNPQLFSPDLSQVAFNSFSQLAQTREEVDESSAFEVGPVGGPYSTLASIPGAGNETGFAGANPGTASVPAFSDVVFHSADHALLPPGPEREAVEKTAPGLQDLYEWTGGRLRLVNVDSEGKLLNPLCGAELGGYSSESGQAFGAISADGSKIFFTSCNALLYMRVDNIETVEVSEPEGVSVAPSERGQVRYDGASADGSKVFFTTAMDLTPAAETEPSGYKLYEYNTEAPVGSRLTLVASGVASVTHRLNPSVVVSEDGSAVYYEGDYEGRGGIFRYETATGKTSFVAVTQETEFASEFLYTTPNGESLLFPSGSKDAPGPVEFLGPDGRLEDELRGAGHEELYRYDAADGSVMCVSCGEGVAPAKVSRLREPGTEYELLPSDGPSTALQMSEDGRRVFFQTNARLVSQDGNETTAKEEGENGALLGRGTDVYEWEADGTEEEPGVFCGVANGCTHLISAGEDVGPEYFLGASASGDDVFFTSAAELVPQATPEFTNIYDARVGGGFPPPPPSVECTSGCQGVGSPPPLFGVPGSGSFEGAGNPVVPVSVSPPGAGVKKTTVRCSKGKRLSHGRCVKAKGGHKRAKAGKASGRGRGK